MFIQLYVFALLKYLRSQAHQCPLITKRHRSCIYIHALLYVQTHAIGSRYPLFSSDENA